MSYLSHIDLSTVSISPNPMLLGWDGYVAFDAYTATTKAVTRQEMLDIVCDQDDEVIEGMNGYHFFDHKDVIKDRDGNHVGSVLYGGERHGDRVMLEVKGYRTTNAVRDLRKASIRHRCTRVDSRLDFDFPNAFQTLLDPVMAIKRRCDLYGNRDGDWDKPELGRTQYVGAKTSPVRVRLYEKGKEPSMRFLNRPDLVRLEVQVRPQGDSKELFALASPIDCWGAANWTGELAGELLQMKIEALKAKSIKTQNALDAKLAWMCKQYGPSLIELLHLHQGDFESCGMDIFSRIAQVQEQARKGRKQ